MCKESVKGKKCIAPGCMKDDTIYTITKKCDTAKETGNTCSDPELDEKTEDSSYVCIGHGGSFGAEDITDE